MSTARKVASSSTKPSDFPRDPRFLDPSTLPFRDEQGVCHVFSHADVMRVLLNAERQFSMDITRHLPTDHHMRRDFMWYTEPFQTDGTPGRHDVLRGVVEPWFRTQAVRTMEPVIRDLARELVDEIAASDSGAFDLATDLGYRLSLRVICRLVGIDREREDWLRQKEDEYVRAATFAESPRQWDLEAYYWSLVAKRLAHPQDELLDVLVRAWTGGVINDRELLGYLSGFVSAGTDTTGTTVVNGFGLLAEFGLLGYVRDRLDDREAMHRVVEEILRFGTAFPALPVVVLSEATFGPLTAPAGSMLRAWLAAANRDEAISGGASQPPPSTFDPTRWPNRHLTFGYGRHYCLGAELARIEVRIVLEEALRRWPGLAIDEAKPFGRFAGIIDGVTEAHFRFDR
jgi:cytochrome P450